MKLKNLLLVILSLFLTVLMGIIFITIFYNEKNNIQKQLFENARNTAASLSLTLSKTTDITAMKTMIDAVFNNGNYSLIKLVNNEGKIIYQRTMEEDQKINVPVWFKNTFKLNSPIANSQVSHGWSPFGILYVQSNIKIAYEQLYSIFKELFIIYIISLIIGIVIIYFLLNLILKPLNKIKNQALSIINNKFIINKHYPFIIELRDVTIAMNKMVQKVKKIFEEANKNLKELQYLLNYDKTTNLYNRNFFINKIKNILENENILSVTNIIISFENIEKANNVIGYIKMNEFFKKIAKTLKNESEIHLNSPVIARLKGAEFGIFDINLLNSENFVKILNKEIDKIIKDFNLEKIINYHIAAFTTNKKDLTFVLQATDKLLAEAKLLNKKIEISENKEPLIYPKDKWKEILINALKNDWYDIQEYIVYDYQNSKIHHISLSISLKYENKTFNFSDFMPYALEFGLSDEIYKKTFSKIIEYINNKEEKYSYKISEYFLKNSNNFIYFLKELPKIKNKNLIFEISEFFAEQFSEVAIELKNNLEKYNLDLGIYNFEAQSQNFEYIAKLNPLFIKSNYKFYFNRERLTHIKNIAIAYDIDLIATGVNEEKIKNKLLSIGIYLIQGAINDKIIQD